MIIQQERQMNVGLLIGESVVFFNQAYNRRHRSGGRNGGRFGRGRSRYHRQRPLCTYFCLLRHMMDKCYKKHEFPIGYKGSFHVASQPDDSSIRSITRSNNLD